MMKRELIDFFAHLSTAAAIVIHHGQISVQDVANWLKFIFPSQLRIDVCIFLSSSHRSTPWTVFSGKWWQLSVCNGFDIANGNGITDQFLKISSVLPDDPVYQVLNDLDECEQIFLRPREVSVPRCIGTGQNSPGTYAGFWEFFSENKVFSPLFFRKKVLSPLFLQKKSPPPVPVRVADKFWPVLWRRQLFSPSAFLREILFSCFFFYMKKPQLFSDEQKTMSFISIHLSSISIYFRFHNNISRNLGAIYGRLNITHPINT